MSRMGRMTQEYLLGIDIGTYESKGVIVDPAGGVVTKATVAHGLDIPRPGWAEHDADRVWWNDFCSLCSALLLQAGLAGADIRAVGCSGIGPDLLPVDDRGKPLRPAILYGIDTRAFAEIKELEEQIGLERLIDVTGNGLSSQSVGPKILWLARHEPEVYRRMRHILTATGYLVFRLTGQVTLDMYTAPTFAPLFNLHKLDWDTALCERIVRPEVLPKPLWPQHVAGEITREAAASTGLVAGTPVVVGTTDAAAEALSVGVTAPGEMMLMYGSTLFMIHVTDRRIVEPRLWSGVYLEAGKWALSAGMATSGALTRWFRDELAGQEYLSESEGGPNAYAALAETAASVPPGSQGLIVLPYWSGERTPINDPLARGVIAGLTLAHTRSHLYRAVLEGIAYGAAHNLEVIHAAGAQTRRVVAVGGGTKNPLWLQIVSDVTGIEQVLPAQTIGAAYGDVFLAALGTGLFKHLDDVKTWVQETQVIQPDPARHKMYQPYYHEYRALYPSIQAHLHRLARLGEGGG